uniref:Bcl-2-binding component 3 n=1 Tax=Pogona vitticeps TaxID=103695 RepID=A0ABM5ERX6_9SAUR
MARALQDGSRRAEPTAAVSGSPAFPVGGTVALPSSVCRTPLAFAPGLNGVSRCRRGQEPPRRRSSGAHAGALQPPPPATGPLAGEEEVVAPTQAEQGAAEPNGHLPRIPRATLEQAIGARLRLMGDQFQQDYEQREHRPQRGALWGHFYHLVFQLLGVLYNLPARG